MTISSLHKTLHHPDPDYTRPLLSIPSEHHEKFYQHLEVLYGAEEAERWLPELERRIKVYYAHKPEGMIEDEKGLDPAERFTEKDLILITYGDMVEGEEPGEHPLVTLNHLVQEYLLAFNSLHILPFFPHSSDRGFSVVDFKAVDPRLGAWQDIWEMDENYQLMFDGVVNHVSSRSEVFRSFINGVPGFEDLFISYRTQEELSEEQRCVIFRPRTSDVLTEFQTLNGPRFVWTTFSPDQIDLNYQNPKVLLYVMELLLFYVRQGADIIRLDAVTYLWAEPGTSCVHLNQTHHVIQLMRSVLDLAAPRVAIVTETNVPHADNISYFGDGANEAHMVYNFALPPLVLHAFYRGDATYLTRWAMGIEPPSEQTNFFNILDTHDGIGLMGVKDILPQEEIDYLVESAKSKGALISFRTADGHDEPYEINATWYSALNGESKDEVTLQVRRLTASRAIALTLKGVPGVYLHGALGSENDMETVNETQQRRDINRAKIYLEELSEDLKNPLTKLSLLRGSLGRLGFIRNSESAFHPQGSQKVLELSPQVLSVLRTSRDGARRVLCLINVSSMPCQLEIPLAEHGLDRQEWRDLVSGYAWNPENGVLSVSLQPYDVSWLLAQQTN
jgi:sucrose phosphorylase